MTFLIILAAIAQLAQLTQAAPLAPGPSAADNPLKGLVPYAAPEPECFPHSMEFGYLPLADLMTGPDNYDWQPLEKLLKATAGRGNQAIFRIWIEYPGQESGLPSFLKEQGVKVTEWENTDEKSPAKLCYTPDYEDERLVRAIENFIAALGHRYDGDARIASITAGLLGSWGEWHTYPREELFASVKTQTRVLEAYEKAFKISHILLRYPASDEPPGLASNANRPFGYHDDSFAWATLDTGKNDDAWFYLPALQAAGDAAVRKWRSQPIGGEVRPEVWGQVHDAKPAHPKAQDFITCVKQTHVSWLMESGIFEVKPDDTRYHRALSHVRKMGYDFYIPTADLSREGGDLKVQLTLINQGVAPFYANWKLELAALDTVGQITHRWPVDWKLGGLLPGEPPREWTVTLDAISKYEGQILGLRVINPLPNGKPLRFANDDQDRHLIGWLSLGKIPK